MPIFNPFHALGLFSVIQRRHGAARRATLRRVSRGIRGRTSSVLRVESDLGDGEFGVDAGVSLIASAGRGEGRYCPDGPAATPRAGQRALESVRPPQLPGRADPALSECSLPVSPAMTCRALSKRGRGTVTGSGHRLLGRDIIDIGDLASLGSGWVRRTPRQQRSSTGRWRWGNDAAGASWTRPLPDGGALEVHGSLVKLQRCRLPVLDEVSARRVHGTTRISRCLALRADLERHPGRNTSELEVRHGSVHLV